MRQEESQGLDASLLEAEWSRFRSQVIDPNTGLPTLSAAMDDVRRLLEERSALALLYIDTRDPERSSAWPGSTDDLPRAFAQALQDLRRDGILEPRDVLAVWSVESDKFLMFLGGGKEGPVGSNAIEKLAAAVRMGLAERVARRLGISPGSTPRFKLGGSLLCRDPMLRAERSVHRALDAAMLRSLNGPERSEGHGLARRLDEIVRGEQFVTLYQPILDLSTLAVVAHEVFTRGPAGGPFEDPEFLFALAEREGRLLEVERLCRGRALGSARRHLRPGTKLFLNTWGRTLQDPEVAGPGFIRQVKSQGLDPRDVILEITERVAMEEGQSYQKALRELKSAGFGIAIDDMGAGYASLQAIVELEPDYLKFDLALARNLERSRVQRIVLETLVELAEKISARVIAEGIERDVELLALRQMGVHLGQGRHFAPPVLVPPEGLPVA